MARRKQSVLSRDEHGNVVYDVKGRPVVERVVNASPSNFRYGKRGQSGAVVSRKMTADERQRYGEPAKVFSYEERKRIGRAALWMTDEERRLHGY